MYTLVNFQMFCNSFPESYQNCFTYEGKRALFDYLESVERDFGDFIELDPIAFACEYTEYANLKEFQSAYSAEYKTLEDIEAETAVIRIDDSEAFIIQNF